MGSLYKKGTPLVPKVHDDEKVHRRLLAEGVEKALAGLLNNIGADTRLSHNRDSTTISDQRAGPDSLIVFMPTNSNGSAALSRFYVDGQDDGKFLLHHVSTSTSDSTVRYAIFG
jgi:hypothetical protein